MIVCDRCKADGPGVLGYNLVLESMMTEPLYINESRPLDLCEPCRSTLVEALKAGLASALAGAGGPEKPRGG